MRLEVLGAVLVAAAAAFAVVARRILNDGMVGLAVSYAMQVPKPSRPRTPNPKA